MLPLVIIALTAIAFLIDLRLPPGYADWPLYLIPLLLTARLPSRSSPLYSAAVSSVLMGLSLLISPPGPLSPAFFNRAVGVVALWVVAALLLKTKRNETDLLLAKEDLEERVRGRTEALAKAIAALQDEVVQRTQAEAAFRASEERFRLTVDHVNDAILYLDLTGIVRWANRQTEALTGRPLATIIGHPFTDTLSPACRALKESRLETVRQGRSVPSLVEYQLLAPDGRVISIEANCASVERDGDIQGRLLIARDITERKRAMSAMIQKQQYEDLVNSIDGIVWELDARTLRYTFVSSQAEKLLGYPPDRWLTEPTFWQDHLHPEDRDRMVNSLGAATAEARPLAFEYRMITADRRTLWIRDLVAVVVEQERPAKLRGVMVDITPRKLAEEEQRLRGERLRAQQGALMALAQHEYIHGGDLGRACAVVSETAARTMRVERASVWLYSAERHAVELRDSFELATERHSTETSSEIPPCLAGLIGAEPGREPKETSAKAKACDLITSCHSHMGTEAVLSTPIHHERKVVGTLCQEQLGGSRTWTEDERSFAGSLATLVSLAIEASHRRKAQGALHAAQEELLDQQQREKERVEEELKKAREGLVSQTRLATLGQLSGNIAHELRNPLGAIRNALHLLKRRVPEGDSRGHTYLDIMEEEVQTGTRIITNLTELARGKAPNTHRVDLAAIIEEARDRARLTKGVRLQAFFDPDPFMVRADPVQLVQVFVNLFQNATQATVDKGDIILTASRDQDYDEIIVRDSGPGIAPEFRERVFEPLFSTKAKGTGLGLAICRQILERHGGTIALADSREAGAAFSLRLPRERPVVSDVSEIAKNIETSCVAPERR